MMAKVYRRTLIFAAVAVTALFLMSCTGLEYLPRPLAEVTITAPEDGATVSNDVTLMAEAVDEIGGSIASLVTWTSDVDGDLGSGGELTVMLSTGPHEIIAEVDDGNGRTDQKIVNITVE